METTPTGPLEAPRAHLDHPIAALDRQMAAHNAAIAESTETLDAVKSSLLRVFKAIGCDEKLVVGCTDPGDDGDLTLSDSNLLQFLGVVRVLPAARRSYTEGTLPRTSPNRSNRGSSRC